MKMYVVSANLEASHKNLPILSTHMFYSRFSLLSSLFIIKINFKIFLSIESSKGIMQVIQNCELLN